MTVATAFVVGMWVFAVIVARAGLAALDHAQGVLREAKRINDETLAVLQKPPTRLYVGADGQEYVTLPAHRVTS